MQNQNTQPTGMLADLRSGLNLMQAVAFVIALPVELLLRQWGSWGSRYLGGIKLLGLFWPPVFGAFCGPSADLFPVLLFWHWMFLLLLIHFCCGFVRRRRGEPIHSKFIGRSWFEKVPGFRRPSKALNLEVFVALMATLLVFIWLSKPLAAMLLISTLAHSFNLSVIESAQNARLRALRDAQIENEYLMELYKQQKASF